MNRIKIVPVESFHTAPSALIECPYVASASKNLAATNADGIMPTQSVGSPLNRRERDVVGANARSVCAYAVVCRRKNPWLGFAPPALARVRISHPLLILPDGVTAGRDARRTIYYNGSYVSRAH
jgi:hypothetical protein